MRLWPAAASACTPPRSRTGSTLASRLSTSNSIGFATPAADCRMPSSPLAKPSLSPSDSFDLVLSHEVIEHVADDRVSARELARVAKPGGIIMIFCPNRWYPFETHGHYWRGVYHFGNTPLINYLPDKLRDKLAPHVRAYTQRGIRRLFADCPVEIHPSRAHLRWL